MARTRYIPEQEKRERRFGRDDEDFKTEGFDEPVPSSDNETPWEFLSVENFIEQLLDEERDWFTTGELVALAQGTGKFNTMLRLQLEELGLSLRAPGREKNFATFGTNQHDRFLTPEAKQMSGGGGGNSILGMV